VTAPNGVLARIRSRRPLWAVYPTKRLAQVVAASSVLWLLPEDVGVMMGALSLIAIGAVVVFDYVRLPRGDRVAVTRTIPDQIGLGDRVELQYTIASLWRWRVFIRLSDEIPTGIATSIPSTAVDLGPLAERTITVEAEGDARGHYTLGDVGLRVNTSLGLLNRVIRAPLRNETTVIPSFSNVRRFRLLAMQNRLSDAGVRALKQRGEGTSFAGMRDYVPGDDPRQLDWKSTARHSRLIVREQSIERSQTVISLVDCGRAMTQTAGRFTRFEHVLSASLVLSDVASTSGDRVGLIAFDDTVRAFVPPQQGATAIRSVRSALSGLDATLTEPDYAAAFRLLAMRQRRRALVLFFTDVLDVRTARSFIAYAGRAAQRHSVVIVALQNDALLEAARPGTDGSLALFKSAAAEELIREREEALARMRHVGVTVLDVSPSRMAAAVVNRYLEIKSRGLL
jgi:uncharacterized protein (DUF58 family)